ncbi:MAG: hypothetical protein ABSG67_06045 [Thermoguttaceae bacterium]|jgi:hypothetical protein
MWLATLITSLALTQAAAEAQTGPPVNTSALPSPIVTRQTLFSIPFSVDQPAESARQPVEVQLLVSHDNGAHWQLYARVQANQKQIPFRTATDGEYWFAIRTVDRAGKFHPETISVPGLRVIVDTAPPRLQLTAQCGQAGQINVKWQIGEQNPKPDSFSLQYRSLPNGAWQTVAVDEKNSKVSDGMQSGEVSWWPQPGLREIQIRAEVADAAGNKSVSHAQVKIDKDAAPNPSPAVVGKDKIEPAPKPPAGSAATANKTERLANRTNNIDLPSGTAPLSLNPPIGNRYQAAGDTPADPELRLLPPGERPRMINTRLFELDYDLESVGPSGVSRVELWGTRDGGRTWRMYAVDDDNRSPISVSVDEEGIYGFRIVATSGAGLSQAPPKSGDLPSIWVGVDLTKPIARIISADLGKGKDDGQLIITWEASDKMLADRPVTLAFSQNPNGPWTTIATGLENTGRYTWTIDSRVPPLIYLRLEVRDEAGNLSIDDRKAPIALDQVRPTAKIREVRPVAKSAAPR